MTVTRRFYRLGVTFSDDGHVGDIKAALDSYAAEIVLNGVTYVRQPLIWCGSGWGILHEERREDLEQVPAPNGPIANQVELNLVLTGLKIPETPNARVPFWVKFPLGIWLSFRDYHCAYRFEPDAFYRSRFIASELSV